MPEYALAEVQRLAREAREAGREVIDLGVGDPDIPTPEPIVERARRALGDAVNHRYPFGFGLMEFREAAADYLRRRFGVEVDPRTEILPLTGSKDAIAHLPLALLDPGQAVLFSEPGYPAYRASAIFADCEPQGLPLREAEGYLPRLENVDADLAGRTGLVFLNYPNNPTGACASPELLGDAADWTAERGAVLCHDAPYLEVTYSEERAPSALAARPGAPHLIELHSLSKTFSMCGWRIGFAAGSAELLAALGHAKNYIDTGTFLVVQHAAAEALNRAEELIPPLLEIYRRRRDLLVEGLRAAGWRVEPPAGTFYLWTRVPTGETSIEFSRRILAQHAVVITPGSGIAAAGEGYLRLSFTASEDRIARACERLRRST